MWKRKITFCWCKRHWGAKDRAGKEMKAGACFFPYLLLMFIQIVYAYSHATTISASNTATTTATVTVNPSIGVFFKNLLITTRQTINPPVAMTKTGPNGGCYPSFGHRFADWPWPYKVSSISCPSSALRHPLTLHYHSSQYYCITGENNRLFCSLISILNLNRHCTWMSPLSLAALAR